MTDGSHTPPEDPTGGSGWLPPTAPGQQPAQQWHQGDRTAVHQPAPAPIPPPAPQVHQPAPGYAPPAPSTYPPPAPGYTWAPQPSGPSRPTNGTAIAALIVGISSLLFTVFAFGLLFIFTLPGGIVAWVLGVKGKRAAATGPQDDPAKPGGRAIAQAGMWCGIASFGFSLLAAIFYVILFSTADINWDELERDNPDSDNLFSSVITLTAVATRFAVALH